jgi:CNT family concentrative nucleoside transporter
MNRYQLTSVLGLFVMLAIPYMMSRCRQAIQWRTVFWGTALQFIFALIVLRTAFGKSFFLWVNDLIMKLLSFQREGGMMVFNALSIPPGETGSLGFFFAFQVLTTIIFFSALISVLYHLGVMQLVVLGFARVMKKFLRTSGAETVSASANIFIGQTEAPLLVKPFIKSMTESELLCVMVAGMATVAGSVMGAYVGVLKDRFPDIAGHLLAASLMSAPAAIVISKILIPEQGSPETAGTLKMVPDEHTTNVLEAAAAGASTGTSLAINVATMLIAFMGLLALANAIVGQIGFWLGYENVTLQLLLGYLLAPLAWVMGTPWEDSVLVGQLIGEKTVLNELVAFFHFGEILRDGTVQLSERSIVIATYALTGFSNFMSIGIQIGGIGALAPERRGDLARLGVLALVGGSLACFMTACIAGILMP